jgi:molybdopterin converting factor small subunit
MHVRVTLYGAARVVMGQPVVEAKFDSDTVTLEQVLHRLVADYPRARPYLLDEAGMLPSNIRALINNERPEPDAALATVIHDEDRLTLLVAVAGGEISDPAPASKSSRT